MQISDLPREPHSADDMVENVLYYKDDELPSICFVTSSGTYNRFFLRHVPIFTMEELLSFINDLQQIKDMIRQALAYSKPEKEQHAS